MLTLCQHLTGCKHDVSTILIANLLTRDTGQAKKGPKMPNFLPIFGLAFLAVQVLRDCETKFKSRLARDARPLAKPSHY